jgi:B12-binding domain/radical SAM domain protein
LNKVSVILLTHKFNKNSISALMGALQTYQPTNHIEPQLYWNIEDTLNAVENDFKEGLLPIVCFSFTTLHFLDTVKDLIFIKKKTKELGISAVFVAGGAHASGSPEETLRCGFDYVLKGEGEYAFPAMVQAFINGDDPMNIKGFCTIKDGKYITNGRASTVDINLYPPFPDVLKQFSYIEITRGCPVACKYCQTSYIQGAKYRHRSPDVVLGYAEKLVSLGIKDLRFITPDCLSYGTDDIGKSDINLLTYFLSELKKIAKNTAIHFGSFPSEVFPTSVTEDTMELLSRYASNDNIVIGAQTGSDRLLKHIGRNHTADDVRKAIKIIIKNGFRVNADFMFGLPSETEEDEDESLKFMTELASMGVRVHSHTFMPLAGTPFGSLPPAVISPKTIATLEKLAGHGIQYGSWKAQLEKSALLSKFRQTLQETGDAYYAISLVSAEYKQLNP